LVDDISKQLTRLGPEIAGKTEALPIWQLEQTKRPIEAEWFYEPSI